MTTEVMTASNGRKEKSPPIAAVPKTTARERQAKSADPTISHKFLQQSLNSFAATTRTEDKKLLTFGAPSTLLYKYPLVTDF